MNQIETTKRKLCKTNNQTENAERTECGSNAKCDFNSKQHTVLRIQCSTSISDISNRLYKSIVYRCMRWIQIFNCISFVFQFQVKTLNANKILYTDNAIRKVDKLVEEEKEFFFFQIFTKTTTELFK